VLYFLGAPRDDQVVSKSGVSIMKHFLLSMLKTVVMFYILVETMILFWGFFDE